MSSNNQLDTFRSEEMAAQRTALIGRVVALLLIVPLIAILTPWPGPIVTYGLLLVFIASGWGAWFIAKSRWGKSWHQYAFVSADFALLSFTLLYPNPLIPIDYPPQFALRFGSFVYFFVLLAGLAYVYQPRLVLWGGLSAAISWSIGVLLLLRLPDTVWRQPNEMSVEAALETLAQPTFVDIGARAQEIVVVLIAAGLLAMAVKRARTIALRQVSLAQEKSNLARYFPPKTAELLATKTDVLSQPREQSAAVLFADLVGFTPWSQRHTPAETMALLREVHGLLTEIIFRHNGTLDKFMGDGLMATFGTPEPTARDASNALSAAIDISNEYEELRLSKPLGEGRTLKLAVGVHYGPIVIGDVGTADRLEFAVLGDTVNVASRLEQATRQVNCKCLVSAKLVDAASIEESESFQDLKTSLTKSPPIELRGRKGVMPVYAI